MRFVTRAALGALAAACLLPAAANGAPVSDAFNKPLEDGCQRNVPGLLTYSSPEWVWVNSAKVKNGDNSANLQGTVRDPHTAGEDLPENHLSYDFDFNVVPDPPYTGLAGGSPSANGGKGSGNWDKSDEAEYGTLHLEWESAVVPTYAWPDEHDRVSVWGQWIWDCGHWGEGFDFSAPGSNDPTAPLRHNGDYLLPGETENELIGTPEAKNIRGEQTELHPLEALVVRRAVPFAQPANETQTDAFMSTKGTGAHAEERCAHDLRPPAGQPFQGPDFTACVHDTQNEYQSLSGKTFAFDVPAPPKPSPGARLRYREVQRFTGHHASEAVTPTANGIHVRVSFDKVAAGTLEDFGRSYFVGWENDASAAPAHLLWTLESIKVNKSLDPNPDRAQQTGVPPGEYNLYVDLNGLWQFVGGRGPAGVAIQGAPPQWVGGLGAVQDGQVFSNINRSLEFFVAPGKPVRLFVDARECDLPHMDPCAFTTELSDGNDAPGDHADTFPSVDAALGRHTLKPETGDYEMTYSIRRFATAPPSLRPPPVARCVDLRAPQSRFLRHGGIRLSRHGLRMRGRAIDRGSCGLARVLVAVGRRTGKHGCRWLRANGRARRRSSCRYGLYFPAHGLTSWSARIPRRLPSSTYIVRSRAIDRYGNVEIPRRHRGAARNVRSFTIR